MPSMSSGANPASAMAARQASTASETGSRIRRRPRSDRPIPEITDRCSYRSSLSGGRTEGRTGSATGLSPVWPVGSNSGSHTSSTASKRTCTSVPIPTSSGSQSTMLVVRWIDGSSANATLATMYGGSKSGSHCWWFTVTPMTVARPDIGRGDHDELRHAGHTGAGGWTSVSHSSQPWIRRTPS